MVTHHQASQAKLDTIKFISLDMEAEIVFSIPAAKAQNYVQHMRVILSRMKKEVKMHGKRVKKFKMVVTKVEKDPNNDGFVLITLKKTQKAGHKVAEDLINFLEKQLAIAPASDIMTGKENING